MSDQKIPPIVIILPAVVVVVFVIAGLLAWGQYKDLPQQSEQVVCTQEAMQCPDGSYVSRTGPNCEFAACPVQDNNLVPADWKTYANAEYGFEIQIPVSWITDQIFGNTIGFTTQNLEDEKLKNIQNCKDFRNDGSCITEFQGYLAKFQYFNRDIDLRYAFKVSKINLNQIPWTRYEMPSIDYSINYVTAKDGSSYNFEIFNPKDEDSLRKILSTFKFTK